MNKRLAKIKRENAKFEKESPYNFCDRWCERCVPKKQLRCKLYQDELEQRLACIAHGKEPDDPEITEKVMERQFNETEEKLNEFMEEQEIDPDLFESPEFEPIREHIKFVESNPLDKTVDEYRRRAHKFLEDTFYNKKVGPELVYDFETVAWHHTLLGAKLHRALCGFHEPAFEDEFALYDAVAQLDVCKKAITESVKALRKLAPRYSDRKNLIDELFALLHNLLDRIVKLEATVR